MSICITSLLNKHAGVSHSSLSLFISYFFYTFVFPVEKVWASSPFITFSIRLRRLAASTVVSCSWELQTKCSRTFCFFLFMSTNNVKSKSSVHTRVVCIRLIPQWQEPLLSKTTKETHQWVSLGQGEHRPAGTNTHQSTKCVLIHRKK